jgi:hypothetical protein
MMELPSSEDLCRPFYNAFLFSRLQSVTLTRHIELRLCNHCCCGKAMSIAQPVCVCVCVCVVCVCVFVTLSNLHAMRMLHIVIFGLPRSTIFFTFSHKRQDFLKKLLNAKCVLWFYLQMLSETFLILRRNERDMIKNYIGLHVKYPFCFTTFNEIWNFRDRYSKNSQISVFIIVLLMGAQLFHADGQTWRS